MTDMTVRSFYADYYMPLKLRARSPRSKELYEDTLRHFERHLKRAPLLTDLTDDVVSRFLCWFRGLPRAPSTVNRQRNNILAVWRFAARKHFVESWPDVEPEAEPETIPVAWTREQLGKLFQSIEQERGTIGVVPARHWWRALHLVLWDTGERITAILLLTWPDVDLRKGFISVPAENRKGKKRGRLYRISPATAAALYLIKRAGSDVFSFPYNENYIWYKYKALLRRAGLPSDRLSMFHRMRRSVASHVKAAGGNPTEILGHSRSSITDRYLDPRIAPKAQAIDLLFRPEVL